VRKRKGHGECVITCPLLPLLVRHCALQRRECSIVAVATYPHVVGNHMTRLFAACIVLPLEHAFNGRGAGNADTLTAPLLWSSWSGKTEQVCPGRSQMSLGSTPVPSPTSDGVLSARYISPSSSPHTDHRLCNAALHEYLRAWSPILVRAADQPAPDMPWPCSAAWPDAPPFSRPYRQLRDDRSPHRQGSPTPHVISRIAFYPGRFARPPPRVSHRSRTVAAAPHWHETARRWPLRDQE